MDNADISLNRRTRFRQTADKFVPKRSHDDIDGLDLFRKRRAGAKGTHFVIGTARFLLLIDPAYRADAVAVAIFGGLNHDVRFVFGGALLGCFGPGAQQDVWKSRETDFVGGMGYLYEQPSSLAAERRPGSSSK